MVGLGNPGPKFAGHRHNVGAMVADLLAGRSAARFSAHRGGRADVTQVRLAGQPVVLAKPRSFMNESGGPVAGLRSYFRVPLEQVVVVHDELDLDYGRLRLKCGGGENGHNGLRSISRTLGSRDYHRVRVGIGRPPERVDPADYVLHDFSAAERKELPLVLERAADAVETLLGQGLAVAQNAFNGT